MDQLINTWQTHSHISRANFTSSSSHHYGQDFYDERMQASGTLALTCNMDSNPVPLGGEAISGRPQWAEEYAEYSLYTTLSPISDSQVKADECDQEEEAGEDKGETARAKSSITKAKRNDPLRWFGILTPPSLKAAQLSAIQLVDAAVKLASKEAKMNALEIEIRRARKRKLKLEQEEAKSSTAGSDGELKSGCEELRPAHPKLGSKAGCGRAAV